MNRGIFWTLLGKSASYNLATLFLSNYIKRSSICISIKPGNSSLPDPCQRGPEINVGSGSDWSLDGSEQDKQ